MTKLEHRDLLVKLSAEGKFPCYDTEQCYCMYRHPEKGTGCAVGVLIPDEEYETEMECGSSDDLFRDFPKLLRHIPEGVSRGQLRDIQRIHDSMTKEWNHERFVQLIQPHFKETE